MCDPMLELDVLFLDIDGVFNSARTSTVFGGIQEWGGDIVGGGIPHDLSPEGLRKFDWISVGLVRAVCFETNCSIVISSSWRYDKRMTVKDYAVKLNLPVMDTTPRLPQKRGYEIQAWLDAHKEVRHYAILDDDSDMLPHHFEHFVKTSALDGVLYQDYLALKRILTGKLGHHRHNHVFDECHDPNGDDECEPLSPS
jgi:hypothetical protein